mgnify:CR=1 FL=1
MWVFAVFFCLKFVFLFFIISPAGDLPSSLIFEIKNFKITEVEQNKAISPIAKLEKSKYFESPTLSLQQYIKRTDKSGIIAEFKRRSPSNKNINYTSNIIEVVKGYEKAGAVGVSILTNKKFFDGSGIDIVNVRDIIDIPILKKEFIISEYQIFQAKSLGSDAILLIASILTKEEILNFSSLANSLGLEVLLEVHSGIELNKISGNNIDIIGVNNRNLDTLEIDINNSIELYSMIPDGFVKISESGISDPRIISGLKEYGFQGFLIGENFMNQEHPGVACQEFINQIR